MDGFQGAVLTVKLKHIGAWNETRCELAARYGRFFRGLGLLRMGRIRRRAWCCRMKRREQNTYGTNM